MPTVPARIMGTFKVTIHRETNGDFYVEFDKPKTDPDTPYEMVKLSLIYAEHRDHLIDQCTVANIDEGNYMLKISEIAVDHEGFYQALRERRAGKPVADVDKYQLKLPFEEDLKDA